MITPSLLKLQCRCMSRWAEKGQGARPLLLHGWTRVGRAGSSPAGISCWLLLLVVLARGHECASPIEPGNPSSPGELMMSRVVP